VAANGGVQNLRDNTPWRGAKNTVYGGGIRVPAAIRWPEGGLSGGKQIDSVTGYIDIYPTLKRVAGIETPSPNPIDGRDMLDVYRGDVDPTPRLWFSYVAKGEPDNIALFDGRWKLVVTGGSVLRLSEDTKAVAPNISAPRVELFDLTIDPREQDNIAPEHAKVITRMLNQLQKHRRLKPTGIPDFMQDREGFKAPQDWLITN